MQTCDAFDDCLFRIAAALTGDTFYLGRELLLGERGWGPAGDFKILTRTVETVCAAIGDILQAFTPEECANYFSSEVSSRAQFKHLFRQARLAT